MRVRTLTRLDLMTSDHQWWEYVQRVTGRASQSEIARRVGLSPAAVNRWQHTGPKPANVSEFARAYDRPVTEAMIAAGYMSEADLPTAKSTPKASPLPLLRDEVDEAIWALEALDEELRRSFILQRHAREELDETG